jgi:hypothetical protein
MNNRILHKICYFLHSPDKLLSCCKKIFVKRVKNIRWKNRIYYKDNRIKIKTNNNLFECSELLEFEEYDDENDYDSEGNLLIKEIWFKYGEKHRDEIDPKTGLTLPAYIDDCLKKWYKYGKMHRDDIDPITKNTLPAFIDVWFKKKWYKDGECHCDNIDTETGLTLPASIEDSGNYIDAYWYKNGNHHRYDIDPETGFILPSIIEDYKKEWCKDGILHRDDIDPETGINLPVQIWI